MRHHVPFVGERKVVRGDDEQARAKRTGGRVIDDVVGDGKVESSWDDLVPDGWLDKSNPQPAKPPSASASAARPRAHVPLKPGSKSSSVSSPAKKVPPARSSSLASPISFSDSASMDWVHINNGRGLRVSIYGKIDNNLRREWSRLLNDVETAHIKEFEFDLTETPALTLTGLGMLLLFKERKGSKRDDIRLCNCNNEVMQLLQWTAMDNYFAIESTHLSGVK